MSRENLPVIQQSMNKQMDYSDEMEYMDSDNFELDKDKKALMERVMKSSTEIHAIGILAKDLNTNIEVSYK